ncbi:Lrp/AsnC family transcriptional regulator [Lampropedia aestuarii]|uniref:Lrp/AsnC family transcriptional regulator n=1 Tax=Lampropedia aestuarii TaxID=2562762 RepID=UPI002469A500|nr:Lrp/AsnC family transcriptional regulator [Lampropedia aestuarii]MDH5859247.1 Lrp/AsnC family transcriptional regulator [Lampropedia aestuarii]
MESRFNLDQIDRKILLLIQENGRLTNAEIAEKVCLSPPACWKRIKRLETNFIQGYHATLNPQALGYGIFAFVNVMLESHSEKAMQSFEAEVCLMPNIVSCHNISGKYDYLLQIVVGSMEDFHRVGMRKIRELGNVKEVYTGFSLKEVKRSPIIPLENF